MDPPFGPRRDGGSTTFLRGDLHHTTQLSYFHASQFS
jgi:hypothetical protein